MGCGDGHARARPRQAGERYGLRPELKSATVSTWRWCPRSRRSAPKGAGVKPRLRGVSHKYAFFVVARLRRRADPGGVRREGASGRDDLRGLAVGAAGDQRALSPGHLASDGAALDEAAGSLDDLRADRRHLHAGCAARAEGLPGEHDPDRAVGRGAGRRRVQARCGSTRRSGCSRGSMSRWAWCRRPSWANCPRQSAGSAWPGWRPAACCT